jgi:hypothetical protein
MKVLYQHRRIYRWPAATTSHWVEAQADVDRTDVTDRGEVQPDNEWDGENCCQYGQVPISAWQRDIVGEHCYHPDEKVADPEISDAD